MKSKSIVGVDKSIPLLKILNLISRISLGQNSARLVTKLSLYSLYSKGWKATSQISLQYCSSKGKKFIAL